MKRLIPLALCGALLFVWPIPGTIALRHLLLALSLATLILVVGRKRIIENLRPLSLLLGMMLLLTAWFVLQAIFISEEPAWALGELRGQWLLAMIAFVIGCLAALNAQSAGLKTNGLVTAIVLALLAQAIFALGMSLPYYFEHGVFPQGKTDWVAGKLEASYLNNLMLAFLAVDVAWRLVQKQAFLVFSGRWLVVAIGTALLSNYAFGARNGIIGSAFMFVSLIFLLLIKERQKLGLGKALTSGLGILLLLGGVGISGYLSDPRWQVFAETAQIAWQIDEHKAWLDSTQHPYPKLRSGQAVDPSAYSRIAWIHAGVRLVKSYPWGVGYGRNAFGHALRKTTAAAVGHAHSGVIDLAVGGGWPALILWLAFIGVLVIRGLGGYLKGGNPYGLVLFFVASGFTGRMVLDSVNRDHMIQLFFFMVGVLLISLDLTPLDGAKNDG